MVLLARPHPQHTSSSGSITSPNKSNVAFGLETFHGLPGPLLMKLQAVYGVKMQAETEPESSLGVPAPAAGLLCVHDTKGKG